MRGPLCVVLFLAAAACNARDHDDKTSDDAGGSTDQTDTDVVIDDTDVAPSDTDCGATDWYADVDEDDYGDPATAQRACEAPPGTVADPGDCDDADGARNPGQVELCDGIDNDCDGVIDNADLDGDGWVSCPTSGGQLDILVVVDDSSSMADEQAAMGAQSGAFFDQLTTGRFDWRIAVITTSQSAQVGVTIDPTLASPRDAFTVAVARGALGSDDERPLQRVDEFLATSGWRRPGASLAVWVLSDEDDFSPNTLDQLRDRMRAGGPDTSFVFSTISGGWSGCEVSSSGRKGTPAPRLAELAARTNGAFASICDADWFGTWADTWIPTSHVDCDDGDAAVFPGAGEACNTFDDNCDGAVDEDADGDGLDACADCDDADPHRGGAEVCDGVDNDCSGSVPAGEADGDGDGVRVCGGDCDDSNAGVHPGAVERCDTPVDEDCDGHAQHDATSDGDADGDGYSACAGDCDDADDTVLPNAPEQRFNGVDDDCDADLDGRDRDVVYPVATVASTARVTFGGGVPWLRLCGTDYADFTVGTDGWIVPGGSSLNDWTPTVDEMLSYAPFVAAGWSNLTLNQWTTGRFLDGYPVEAALLIVKRSDTASVVWDNVPVVGGGAVTSIATIGDDGVDVALLASDAPGDAMVGWACGAVDWVPADTSGGAPVCLDLGAGDAVSFTLDDLDGVPARASSTCTP